VTGDAYGRQVCWRDEQKKEERRKNQRTERGTRRLETQNVRGFVKESRKRWIGAWRRTPVRNRPGAWLLQETHVSSAEEAIQLKEDWARAWGKPKQTDRPQLSYWSVHDERTGGVAILLNPGQAETAEPWHEELWTHRVIAVRIGETVVVDVYAPNTKTEREHCVQCLQVSD
jgi:exonuclease III